MDTKKDSRIPECGNLAALKHFKVVVGAKQLRKALENGRARFVFMAQNADPALTEPLAAQCQSADIPVSPEFTMKELGQAAGIHVGAAVVTVLKKN